jgi:hypothetical protein
MCRHAQSGSTACIPFVRSPAALHLKTGRTCRFRLINITPATDNLPVSLHNENGLVTWRQLAKDAFDVKKEAPQKADQRVAIGETFDFEYRAEKAGEVTLQGWPTGKCPARDADPDFRGQPPEAHLALKSAIPLNSSGVGHFGQE